MDRRVEARPRWKRRLFVAAGAGVVLAIAVVLYVRFALTRSVVVDETQLALSPVKQALFTEYVPAMAVIAPRTTAYLDAIEGGQVAEVLVEEGAFVTRGQVLLKLKNTNLQLEMLGRQAQLMEQLDRLNATILFPLWAGVPLVRISREDIPATLRFIDETWNELAPKVALQREFTDFYFNQAYERYGAMSAVLRGLAAFAFFISIMGLCGLAIHVTSRRKREIGIRKTLGTSARGVVLMLLFDFAKPVLIANLIAWPFAYLIGRAYLNQFVERTELTVWPFALSLVVTVGVAWAAVAVQALRAAAVKPANVLYAQ